MRLVVFCVAQQLVLAPAGTASRQIAGLTLPILLIFSGVSVVMWVLIAWVATRRTGSFATHAPWTDDGGVAGRTWIRVGGIAIPVFVLSVMLVVSLRDLSSFAMVQHGAPDIRVIGHQWWWEVHYLQGGRDITSANEVHVPAGRHVDIELISRDVIHSFWVPELHGKVDLIPGVINHIQIDATEPGMFTGQCAEYCGAEHALMRLVVRAERPAGYDTWLSHESEAAATPSSGDAAAGLQVFMSHQCSLCHTVRGTVAGGQVGPDLTHFGSRSGLAANAYPNDVASLSAWVTHAQAMKPDAGMPNITAFTGPEIQALVAYLRQLQ
jgi:cytochrome c oxidase subunit 2